MARRMIHMPADTDLFHLKRIHDDATALLVKYGLAVKDWKVVFDNTKRRGGQCRYAQREIGISAHLFAIWEYEHSIQIVLHEIAHALCPGHKHDKVWRAKAREIGYHGKRCWGTNGEKEIGKWIGTCPKGHTVIRQRKSKVMDPNIRRSCGSCSSSFNPAYPIVWKENK